MSSCEKCATLTSDLERVRGEVEKLTCKECGGMGGWEVDRVSPPSMEHFTEWVDCPKCDLGKELTKSAKLRAELARVTGERDALQSQVMNLAGRINEMCDRLGLPSGCLAQVVVDAITRLVVESQRHAALWKEAAATGVAIGQEERRKEVEGLRAKCAEAEKERDALKADVERLSLHAAGFPNKPDWVGEHLQSWIKNKDLKADQSSKIAHEALDRRIAAESDRDLLAAEVGRLRKELGEAQQKAEVVTAIAWQFSYDLKPASALLAMELQDRLNRGDGKP